VIASSNESFFHTAKSKIIHIVYPARPKPPCIEQTKNDNPFVTSIQWSNEEPDIDEFHIFVDGELNQAGKQITIYSEREIDYQWKGIIR
jgi:hypothetical protein